MHESLWVLIGTVAPVIAVGNTVTVVRGIELLHGVRLVRDHDKTMWPRTLVFSWVTLCSALISLIMSVAVLLCAALSLAVERDIAPPNLFAWLSALSMVLLLPQLGAEWWIRGMTFFDEEVVRAKGKRAREKDRTFTNKGPRTDGADEL